MKSNYKIVFLSKINFPKHEFKETREYKQETNALPVRPEPRKETISHSASPFLCSRDLTKNAQ